MNIVYAMLEDRMRSFLFYIGAIEKSDDLKLNVAKTKGILRNLYFDFDEDTKRKRINLNQISTKERLIRKTLEYALNEEEKVTDSFLDIIKEEYLQRIDIIGFIDTLSKISQWREYRNEVIHGLLNKNMESLNSNIREQVELGMKYARFIDSQVKALKKKNAIRKKMKIKQ